MRRLAILRRRGAQIVVILRLRIQGLIKIVTGIDSNRTNRRLVAGAYAEPKDAPKLIIAGGLRADNVREAIRTFRPWGVDVASGVESTPGRKDPERLRQFITAARSAERV